MNRTESSLVLEFIRGTGAGTEGNEKIAFYIDELFYRRQGPVIAGPTGLVVELPFVGFYADDADASALRCVAMNAEAGATYL